MKRNIAFIVLLAGLASLFFSCSTVPAQINPDIKEEMFFKNAQEAMDENRYNVALYYYEVYLVRYPENHQKTIGAEYEKAFIYYKMKEYKYSRDLFEGVLDQFDNSPFAAMYPERYKILSVKMLEKIDQELNPKKKEKTEKS